MADPELYRDKAEVQSWRVRDPIPRFGDFCVESELCSSQELAQIGQEVEGQMLDAVAFAERSPWPDPAEVGRWIYAKPIDPEAEAPASNPGTAGAATGAAPPAGGEDS
jgi:pyruvate dehydrogenase E1 component alpha subunit